MNLLIFINMTIVANSTLTVKSIAFEANGFIPAKYTCQGKDINPPLTIGNLPPETKSIALIMDDPDASSAGFDHWVMWNIPPKDKIEENSAPGKEGKNGRNENKYKGPCPPSGTHHYHFRIFALDTMLELDKNTDKMALLKAIEGHTIATGELIGLYKK